MKNLKLFSSLFFIISLVSCSNERIGELEDQIEQLQRKNEVLQKENEDLKLKINYIIEIIYNYENQVSSKNRYINNQNIQQQQREWHQQSAQQHMREAEFWRQNGNEFLYENSMRNAQQDLNMMP